MSDDTATGTELWRLGAGAILTSMRRGVTVNLLGLPAVAVPTGLADGPPQGVQVIGPRYREDLCLGAAQAIEDGCVILAPI